MQKRLYNLDGLRFVAALVVLLCHLEAMKTDLGWSAYTGRFFILSAQYAVTFFFVLSGFLITYLLLLEKRRTPDDTLHVTRFYKKRILRIWPVYYLLILFVYFLLPRIELLNVLNTEPPGTNTKQLGAYLFFLPNTAEYLYGKKYALGQTWSLGVEEFFYLFYPLLLYFIRDRKMPAVLMALTLLFIALSSLVVVPPRYFPFSASAVETGFYYVIRYRIFSFLIGGLAAWYLLTPSAKLAGRKLWQQPWLAHLLMVLLFTCMIFGITFSVVSHPLYSVLFALLFYSLLASGLRYPVLNHPVLIYLGKISYGIYMFHPIAILLTLHFFRDNYDGSLVSSIVLQLVSVAVTIIISSVIYETYEKFFLNLGRKKIRV